MAIEKGNIVKIEYEGKLDDGTLFDSSEKHGKPLEFEVGAKKVIKGIDEAVVGMEKGEEKEVKVEPKDAYGEKKEEMVKEIPRNQIPKEAKAGMMLMMKLPNGAQMPVKILEVSEEKAKLDLNHPLAGKNLNFKIKVIEINESNEEDSEEKEEETKEEE